MYEEVEHAEASADGLSEGTEGSQEEEDEEEDGGRWRHVSEEDRHRRRSPAHTNAKAASLSASVISALRRADKLCQVLVDFSASLAAKERSMSCTRHVAAPQEGESMDKYVERLNACARYGRWPGVFAQVLKGGAAPKLGDEWQFWEKSREMFARARRTGRPCEKELFGPNSLSLVGLYGIHPDIAAWVMKRINGTAHWLEGTILRYK